MNLQTLLAIEEVKQKMDPNYITVEEAVAKYCPKIGQECLADRCMMWVWQDPHCVWKTDSPGEGWVRGELNDIAFGSNEPDPPRYEWYKERDNKRGKCGMRIFS